MAISTEQVRHIAELARLRLSREELVTYQSELSSILEYMEQLAQVVTAGISAAAPGESDRSALREDEVHASLTVSDALANAPSSAGNMFSVPKVIDD